MAEFDNEEINRLKQWWDANGMALVTGAVIGLLIIGGWQAWGWYRDSQSSAAADIFMQAQQGIASGEVDDGVRGAVTRLKDDYASTPYAADAALRMAAYDVQQGEYAKAVEQLDWAIANADSDGVRHIARVRKARLLWTRGDAEAALALLDAEHPDVFDALYAELAGDIHAAEGDREAAYKAYQLALEGLPPDSPRRPIENKLADNAPDEDAGAPAEQETPSAS